jgi:hypothetical protein
MLYRLPVLLSGVLLCAVLAGCGGKGSAGGSTATAAAAPRQEADLPSVPKDAQWTILCYSISTPDHVVRSRRLRNDLMQSGELRDWYVVHGESESTLYYGFYRSVQEPRDRDTARARRDRERVQSFTDARGDRVFQHAQFVALDLPGQDGPPEWDIQNAEGFWTLEIGVYRDDAERKRAAVEAVRAARQMGVEAYYFHGPSASSVLIGAWPAEAIRAQEAAVAETRHDPGHAIAIVPPGVNLGANVRDMEGNPVKVFSPRLEPIDPTLIAAMRQYPTYALNGEEVGRRVRDPQTGESRFVPQPSSVVQIPRRAPSLLSGGTGAPSGGAATAPPAHVMPPTAPRPTGGGRLRSIDD